MSPVEENLLAHRVVSKPGAELECGIPLSNPEIRFPCTRPVWGDHFLWHFQAVSALDSKSNTSAFLSRQLQQKPKALICILQWCDHFHPFPRFERALVTGHGSFNCCAVIINPNYQGFFSTNPLEESEMTRPSHCSWGFPWCRSYTGRVCSGNHGCVPCQWHVVDGIRSTTWMLFFVKLQSFGAVRNMYKQCLHVNSGWRKTRENKNKDWIYHLECIE